VTEWRRHWRPAVGFRTDCPSCPRPHAVLVFAFHNGQLLWVRHPLRGWEVPGGKLEAGESATEAALREVWEESGAIVENLRWLAEYQIPQGADPPLYKWVYRADVARFDARPANSEMRGMRLAPPVHPDTAKARPDVSPILQDDVYRAVYKMLQLG
jgi:8-oxo-dGTP diphosphatase